MKQGTCMMIFFGQMNSYFFNPIFSNIILFYLFYFVSFAYYMIKKNKGISIC